MDATQEDIVKNGEASLVLLVRLSMGSGVGQETGH